MTRTTAETLTADGVVLNTYAKNIKSLTGRLRNAKTRTGNITVPGRNGVIRTPRKWSDAAVLDLPMWVVGSHDDGYIPSGSSARIEFFKRVDELLAIFSSPELITIRHTLPDGTTRECLAEVLEVMDFTADSVNPKGLVNVQLVVPDAFWRDTADITQTFTNPTMNSVVNLTNFAGATAPMDDLIFTITGPITNPRLEAYRNGNPLSQPVWVQYTGTIGAGTTAILNCGTWVLSGTASPSYANLSHLGDPRWLSVPPAPVGGSPQIKISGSGNTGATAVQIVGRRKYQVG